jgi:hypothetical protein
MSRRSIVAESEKMDLKNQIETLTLNLDELNRKHHDLSIESKRQIKLDDHLNQIGELKR